MQEDVIFIWIDFTPTANWRWFLRGIPPDGSFYGELLQQLPPHRRGRTVEGKLSINDHARLRTLVHRIAHSAKTQRDAPVESSTYRGQLARGQLSNPITLLRYHCGDELTSQDARAFRELVELIRPYLASAIEPL